LIEVLKEGNALLPQALLFRAYGQVAIENYENALSDIKKVKKITKKELPLATLYNRNLSKGILKMDNEDFLMAAKYFEKAWKIFPGNKDSYLLQAISIVRSYTFSLDGYNIGQQIKYQKVLETKIFMDKAVQNCSPAKEPSLLFFRGLLSYHLHNFWEAIRDFTAAIAIEN
jgi:tetratricopeptide (TPR) repeat protein